MIRRPVAQRHLERAAAAGGVARRCRRTPPRPARPGRAGPGRRRPAACPAGRTTRRGSRPRRRRHRGHRGRVAVQRAAVPVVARRTGRPRSAASARGPGLAQSIRSAVDLVVADPARRRPGPASGVRTASASSSTAARQPVDRHLHADLERVPVDRRGQLGAEPLQRRARTPPSPARAVPSSSALASTAADALAADRLPAGARRRAAAPPRRGCCPGRCAATTSPPADRAADHGREAVRAGGARPGTVGDQRHARSSSGR